MSKGDMIMRYCSKCGSEVLEEAVVCVNCGCKIQENSNKHNNGLDITALVLAVIGFLTGWIGIGVLLDVIAIILGIIALIKAKRTNKKRGLSTAGIIIAAVSLLIMLILLMPSLNLTDTKATIINKTQ